MAASKDNDDRWLKGGGEVLSTLSQRMRQQIWNCLRDDKISVFSVWGQQGVGKSRIMSQVVMEMEEFGESCHLFEIITRVRAPGLESLAKKMQARIEGELVHVQDKLTIRKLVDVGTWHFIEPERQLEVLKMFDAKGRRNRLMELQMGIQNAFENPESIQISIAAKRIKDKLSGQRFILILEDVWESFDLQEMRVPVTAPATTSGSKVMITTQSHEVCSEMGRQHLVMQHPFQRMVSVN
ncbi:disease resistance protein RFL1-like [Magnolia sinica]|uniref:disease resistance protein RFL1-like n=1 Tax=Magnolia sinica TaxID=86752 RepID=UPI00265984C4|nr:disease resistance protein RFL1-like [Magnolia sinica]